MSRHLLSSIKWLNRLKNYEKSTIPGGAGTANSSTWELQNMHRLLAFLNNPQETLNNVIHVVGTKGKGSVAAMLDSVLRDSGYHVGRYTSPHLVFEGERISIGERLPLYITHTCKFSYAQKSQYHSLCAGGQSLSPEALDKLIEAKKPQLEQALEEIPSVSYFEAFTALAIGHFADSEVDWAVIEAGLGGVSDATNVFRGSQVCLPNVHRKHTASAVRLKCFQFVVYLA